MDEFDFELSKYIGEQLTQNFIPVYNKLQKKHRKNAHDLAWQKIFADATYSFIEQRHGIFPASVYAYIAKTDTDAAMKYIKQVELRNQLATKVWEKQQG